MVCPLAENPGLGDEGETKEKENEANST